VLVIVCQGGVEPGFDPRAILRTVAVAHHFGIAKKVTQGGYITDMHVADDEPFGGTNNHDAPLIC
jgi:hypothetical protein